MSDWEEDDDVQVVSSSGFQGNSRGFGERGSKPLGEGRGFGGRGRGRGRGRFGSDSHEGGGDGNTFKCYKCGEEGHMSRDCPSNSSSDRPKSCFKCGEEGHMSRDCPSNSSSDRPRSCFKCGEEGHMSRDCPSNSSSDRPKSCFKCHEGGHMSKDCPKGGSACRKCGEEGHFARECQKSPEKGPQKENADGKPPPMTYIPPELSENQLFEQGVSAGINFAAYDTVSVKVSGDGEIPPKISSFSSSNLRPLLLENVKKAGYQKPTPIQKHAIPIIMKGRDLMGCSQTGSGKTAAFLLPILHYMLENNVDCHPFEEPVCPAALVVSPTRELAIQIFNEAKKFSCGSVIKVCIVYGGTSVAHQEKGFRGGCHILVSTPGRLLDYVERKKVAYNSLKFLVLDEADRMLDMGFKSSMDKIVSHSTTPNKNERQTLMFSATFPESIQQLAKLFLNNYVFVVTGVVGSANDDVKQTFYNVDKPDKRETLVAFIKDQLQANSKEKILVFVETKRMADFIALYLSSSEVSSTSIHGDRFQNQREVALSEFKFGVRNVLVATAVAARGLDIKGVGIVINYDMPKDIDEYVHRIGRTGRVGNPGRAYSYFDVTNDAHLAPGLVKMLEEGGQEVPSWLIECSRTGNLDGAFVGRGNFGAKDIRKGGIHFEEFPAGAAAMFGGPTNVCSTEPNDEECWD